MTEKDNAPRIMKILMFGAVIISTALAKAYELVKKGKQTCQKLNT